ncbi:MFS transporter [Micromonospora sp. NBC_01699]|uniref:MFS transporter n=1 Tax=Micromonospora sp. NBC_01699 TaxID=2975984 RepID=UPI002E2A650A|nr:MFS transporter [Micromonospora sp. NBC_01699]
MTTLSHNGKAGSREWIGFTALLLPLLLVSMDVSVLYFAVPYIAQDLEPTSVQQLWIFDIYGFVLAGLLITMGAVGDRIGRRKLLLIGAAAFGAASLLAAYSTSPEMLITARALLGVGGATLMPSTLALIRNMFHDEKQRNTAVAVWTAALSGGVALGPVISGLLLEHFWWGSVLLINVPFMVLLLVLAPILVPEFKNPDPVRFDFLSALLSLGALLPIIYGIKELAADGFDQVPLYYIGAGVLLAVLFVWRQIVKPGSLIDIDLFKRPAFSGSIAVNLLAMFAIVGFAVFLTQYLQLVRGMSTLEAALWSLVPSLGTGGFAPAAAAIARKVNRAFVMAGGFVIAAIGFAVLTQTEVDSPLWIVLVGAACYAGGLVAVIALVTGIVLGVAPPERAGSASALLESGTELGGALGIAILGSVGTAVFRDEIVGTLPTGLPAEAAAAAEETLAGATVVAGQLPGEVGETVLAAARAAFVSGMDTVAFTAAGVMLASAVVAIVVLKSVGAIPAAPPVPADEPEPEAAQPVRVD